MKDGYGSHRKRGKNNVDMFNVGMNLVGDFGAKTRHSLKF
jgi:hypothetical protein